MTTITHTFITRVGRLNQILCNQASTGLQLMSSAHMITVETRKNIMIICSGHVFSAEKFMAKDFILHSVSVNKSMYVYHYFNPSNEIFTRYIDIFIFIYDIQE